MRKGYFQNFLLCFWIVTMFLFKEGDAVNLESKFDITKPFVEGQVDGKLGNRMFVVAAACALAWDHGAEPIFPILRRKAPVKWDHYVLWRLDPGPRDYGKLYPANRLTVYKKSVDPYEELPYEPNMRLYGFFPFEKYFVKYKDKIRALFAPSGEVLQILYSEYAYIIDHPYTVAIHFRLCPIVEKGDKKGYCGRFSGKKFFLQAMEEYFSDEKYLFVVFSDDIEESKQILADCKRNIIFVHENYALDLYLMSMCKHQIISQSTFSWWAAYLNNNPDKKVVMNPFGRECIAPESEKWIQLPVKK